MGNARREGEREGVKDIMLFLNTWEWLQNYWDRHGKCSERKESPRNTLRSPVTALWALCCIRTGREILLPSGWASSHPLPAHTDWGSNHPHSLHRLSTSIHFTSKPMKAGIHAEDSQQKGRVRKDGVKGTEVCDQRTSKGWSHLALSSRGLACQRHR